MDLLKKIGPLILVIGLSLGIVVPLFRAGYFSMHDDTQPTRVYVMAKAIRDGQLPVRWVSDLGYGYGYPLFNFYAPLPYYFGAAGNILGLDAIIATKLMFAVGILLAPLTMYFLGQKLWGRAGGIISALLYAYAPYHAIEAYIRGAVGEYWAYGFLPLILYGILEIKKNRLKGIFVGVIGLAGVILSHNITAMLVVAVLSLWIVISVIIAILKPKTQLYAIAYFCVFGLGMGLSAFFWLPASTEMRYTRAHSLIEGSNDFRQHFVYLDQLWDSPWGYGGSSPGRADGMSFKLGKVHVLLAILGVTLVYVLSKPNEANKLFVLKKIFRLLFWGAMVSIFMMLPVSQFMWEKIPFLDYVQYPWRWLVFAAFFLSLLGGGLVKILEMTLVSHLLWRGIIVLIFVLVISINAKYFQPQFLTSQTARDYTDESNMRWKISKISDEYLPRDFPIPRSVEETAPQKFSVTGDIIVDSSEIKTQFIKLNVSAAHGAEILFSIANFPGWDVVLDTQKIYPIDQGGKITVFVPPGKHIVTAYFTNTIIRTLGNLISAIAASIVLGLLFIRTRRTNINSQ